MVAESASPYDRYAFLHEATVMKAYTTAYIVQLFGVVSDGQPAMIIMELMARGNLRDYLRHTTQARI
jgi:serine/threonine protein kinase